MNMTFEQFRRTKTACDDIGAVIGADLGCDGEGDPGNTGFIYCGNGYIQNSKPAPNGTPLYYLIIYRDDWIDANIEPLERLLFDFLLDEGALDFNILTRAELAKWYEGNVGYDPTVDEPSMTTDELRANVIEYVNEANAVDAADLAADEAEPTTLREALAAMVKGRSFSTVGSLVAALGMLPHDMPISVAPDDSAVMVEMLSGRVSIVGELAVDEGNVNRSDCL